MKRRAAVSFAIGAAVVSACGTKAAVMSGPSPVSAIASPISAPHAAPPGARGRLLAPNDGRRFASCARPVLWTLKIDSANAPYAQMLAGTGEIRGSEGTSRHRTQLEIIYIRSGWGYAIVARDTTPLAPGSIVHVPPGTAHQLLSAGPDLLSYFWVLGPGASSDALVRAASTGCQGAAPTSAAAPTNDAERANGITVVDPGDGERIVFCEQPLTLTAKIDSERVAGARFVAATAVLRHGATADVDAVDQVALVTHGRGRGFVGRDTMAVTAGSFMYAPRGMQHGFINDGDETLEYFVVAAGTPTRGALSRAASRPGRWCPTSP